MSPPGSLNNGLDTIRILVIAQYFKLGAVTIIQVVIIIARKPLSYKKKRLLRFTIFKLIYFSYFLLVNRILTTFKLKLSLDFKLKIKMIFNFKLMNNNRTNLNLNII